MQIKIDEKYVYIPEELINYLNYKVYSDIKEKYYTLDVTFRLAIKTAVRTFVLPMLEKATGQQIRPPREYDPLLFIIENFMQFLTIVAKDAEVTITTEKNGKQNSPTSFEFTIKDQSEGGRQLVTSWKKGIRQDNIRETATS